MENNSINPIDHFWTTQHGLQRGRSERHFTQNVFQKGERKTHQPMGKSLEECLEKKRTHLFTELFRGRSGTSLSHGCRERERVDNNDNKVL